MSCLADWNKDWMPGPYPETPEQRAAAAKKYGMLPEDYKPMPNDGFGKGDYPDLPMDPWEEKDAHYNWDSPDHRRDFGDPVSNCFPQTIKTLPLNPTRCKKTAQTFRTKLAGFVFSKTHTHDEYAYSIPHPYATLVP